MKKLQEINKASVNWEYSRPEEIYTNKCELIAKLEAGHQTISVGRSVIVIEQCEETDEVPADAKGWNTLRLSVYCDTDVHDDERSRYLYIQASRYGFLDMFLQERNDDKISKSFKMV